MIPTNPGILNNARLLNPAAPNPLEDFARQAFWQAQVPVMLLPGDPSGVTVMTDFGERIHFPDQTAIEFFLMGFRLAEHMATAEPPQNPWETMLVPSQLPPEPDEQA